MKKIISNILFTCFIFFIFNIIFYVLNVSNFLFFNEYILFENKIINSIMLVVYFIIFLGVLLLINNRLFYKLDNTIYYFCIALINCVIYFFINNLILKKTQFYEINNILSLVLEIFFTTYTFYYSNYYLTLLKYKRNI